MNPSQRSLFATALSVLALAAPSFLPACSTVERVTGKEGVSTDKAARYVSPKDPLARPIQVAWTSARAAHCGFMFDPEKLKADYITDERRHGLDPHQLDKMVKAYDYTRESVMDTISADPKYCTKARIDAIRVDLNRYLAGDYSPTARLAR